MTQLANQTAYASVVQAVQPQTVVMSLEGEIARDDLKDIIDMLERLAGQGAVKVVCDFNKVSHFDFRAVPALMKKADAMRVLGGDVRVSGLSPYLHNIFRSAGAAQHFDFFATTEDAVQSFDRAVMILGG